MGRLIISTRLTVDGVMSVEDWYVSEGGHDRAGLDLFDQAAALVLGRKNYEGLAAFWAPMTGPWADRVNPLPKFVASRTLSAPLTWNATLIEGDLAEAVSRAEGGARGRSALVRLRGAHSRPARTRARRRTAVLGPSLDLGTGREAVRREREDPAAASRIARASTPASHSSAISLHRFARRRRSTAADPGAQVRSGGRNADSRCQAGAQQRRQRALSGTGTPGGREETSVSAPGPG